METISNNNWLQLVWVVLIPFVLKIVGAFVIWIIGRMLARLAVRLISGALEKQKFDPTLLSYLRSILSVTLNVILIVAILGFFGIETTSFAALVASIGVAIGLAWSGLLSNFAAGIFLVILRPFQVGDSILAAGVSGTVKEIGLFVTMIDTPDNVRHIVSNNKILSDNILNYTANAYRRVEATIQLNNSVDVNQATQLLKARLQTIPNVLATPAPEVEIHQFTLAGPVLAVRPYCITSHHAQVSSDTNEAIREVCVAARYPAPEQYVMIRDGAKTLAASSAG